MAASLGTRPVTLLVPALGVLFAGSVALVALTPEGSAAVWGPVGLGAALGSAAGTAAALALRREPTRILLAIGVVGVGLWRGAAAFGDEVRPWQEELPTEVRAIATVDGPVETRGSSAVAYVRIERIDRPQGMAPPAGRVRLTLPALVAIGPGDQIDIVGRFEPVNPTVPGGRRLLAQGVIATAAFPGVLRTGRTTGNPIDLAIQQIRSGIEVIIQRALPEPEGALLAGLLVGSASGMPDEFRRALVASGTTHLVVVSGYNITLVAAAFLALARGRRRLRAGLPLVGVWGFTLLAGAAPPTVRAAIMATVALIATRTGRGPDTLAALALAAAGMLLVDPRLALDLGFQLSVLATLGLVTLQPRLSSVMRSVHPWVREPLAGTLAAQLATTPLLAATFHQLSVVAPVANAFAAPAVPVATIGGAVCVAVIAAIPALSGAVGAILAIPLGYLARVIELAAALPEALVPVGDIPPLLAAVYAAALVVWAVAPTPEGKAMASRLRFPATARPVVAAAAALLGTGLVAGAAAVAQAPTLSFSALDVGGGDAIFVRTPGQRTILIDGGANPAALLGQLGRRLGIVERSLSIVVLTRADSERLPAMAAALERYSTALAVAPPEGSTAAIYQRWRAAAEPRLLVAGSAMGIDVEPGLSVDLLPTPPLSGTSRSTETPQRTLMVRIAYGEVAFLVAPSLTPEVARASMANGESLAADVLLVPRHAVAGSLDRELLAAVGPSFALVSASARSRAGPSPETLDLLQGIPTFRTDLHGTVEVKTDGKRLWVSPERG